MNTVTVRNITIGEGIPKICVPVVGKTEEEILRAARQLKQIPADLAEWRVDWYEHVHDIQNVTQLFAPLREILGETPLLFTFRTKQEGGQTDMEPDTYAALNQAAIRSGYVDLIDVELFTGETMVKQLIKAAHASGVKVVASGHDFVKTPTKEDMIQRMCAMQCLDADILKIAVMPRSRVDVLTLLTATEEMYTKYADRPIVTMSMGGDGVVSRLCGELTGSAVTFGAAGQASAPGQMPAEKLAQILAHIHDSMG